MIDKRLSHFFATFALASGLVIALALPAHAQDQAAAQALFDQGLTEFKAGNFEKACSKFEASLDLYDGLGTRGKLAECFEKVGRTASAWAQYREVEARSQRAGDRKRSKVAGKRAKKLEASLSYLQIDVADDARVPGVAIERGGSPVSSGAYGVSVAVDPGPIIIKATAPGYKEWTKELTIGVKEKRTITVTSLEKAPVVTTPDTGTTGTTGGGTTSVPDAALKTSSSDSGKSNTLKYVGIGTLAAGGALIITGSLVGLSAKSKYDAAFDDGLCDKMSLVCSMEGQEETDSARSQANMATIVTSVGILGAATGGFLWWWSGRSGDSEQAVSVSPTGSDESVGFVVTGRF
jgi:hypothetical protein